MQEVCVHIKVGQKEKEPKTVKVVVCQINCVVGKKVQNIARFGLKLLHLSKNDQIDIILFPEMAWTGYNLTKEQAESMAVQYGKGEEFIYASELAKRTQAYVLFGYIQSQVQNGIKRFYDSAAIIDRSGKPLTNTRKTNLTGMDKIWATKWHSFNSIQLFNRKGQKIKCGLPICFDIMEDTDKPEDPNHNEYKFAHYAKEQNCELILFITSWFDMGKKDPHQQWIERFTPLIQPSSTKNVLFLCSDKVGGEYSYALKKDIKFIGSSCAISINPYKVLKSLDKTTEDALTYTYKFIQ